jgi:hypothetical protein
MGDASVSIIDIHDSEVMRIGDVLAKLNEKRGKYTNMEAFRQEIIGRFQDAGFGVRVTVFETDVPDVYAFDIDVNERLEGTFDPDRQVHEVTSDLAGLGTGGVIKTEGGLSLLQGGHSHTHGDGHHHHN